MRRRGFSLLELAIVIVILGLLLAMGYGTLSRYRSNLALNQAVERLAAEAVNAQGQARAFGLPQKRGGALVGAVVPAGVPSTPGTNALVGRIVEKREGAPLQVTKQWDIGDAGGQGVRCECRSFDMPSLPLTSTTAGDQGVCMEIVQGTPTGIPNVLVSLAFESDGRVHLMNNAVQGSIYLSRADTEYVITVSPLGKLTHRKTK